MSHNRKYYVKPLKRNKATSSDIRELWKKKKYSEENIVSIHWQILQLLILAVSVHQVSLKRRFYQSRPGLFLTTYCMRYPHALPFLRNEMPFFLLKNTWRLWGCSILKALNLSKWVVKIHNSAHLLDFPAPFWLYLKRAHIFQNEPCRQTYCLFSLCHIVQFC